MSPRHSLLALLVVVIWGANFVIIDAGLVDVPPLVFLALRFVAVCIPAIFFIKPPTIGWRNILLIGSFLSLGQFALLYLALALGMPPGLASLILQTQVIFSIVISALFLRERPSRRQAIGVLIGMLGLVLVIVGHSASAPWLPLLVVLGSALSWASSRLYSRCSTTANNSSASVSGSSLPAAASSFSAASRVMRLFCCKASASGGSRSAS